MPRPRQHHASPPRPTFPGSRPAGTRPSSPARAAARRSVRKKTGLPQGVLDAPARPPRRPQARWVPWLCPHHCGGRPRALACAGRRSQARAEGAAENPCSVRRVAAKCAAEHTSAFGDWQGNASRGLIGLDAHCRFSLRSECFVALLRTTTGCVLLPQLRRCHCPAGCPTTGVHPQQAGLTYGTPGCPTAWTAGARARGACRTSSDAAPAKLPAPGAHKTSLRLQQHYKQPDLTQPPRAPAPQQRPPLPTSTRHRHSRHAAVGVLVAMLGPRVSHRRACALTRTV